MKLEPRALARRLRPHAAALAIAVLAIAIAWTFAATTLAHATAMGLPLDDSYIYLTYAKQFGRAQPFTYFSGGGYSAGSTSILWPMLLAPFWALGARGHALVWVSFGLCAALYAAVAVGVYRFTRGIAGELAGIAAAVVTLAIAPFAWCALSGMEVAFASALLVAMLLLLVRAQKTGAPSRALGACLAAASLSRPEAMLVAGFVCVVCAFRRRRELRAAAWWLAPMAAPAIWLVANRVLAGNFFPNTGVVKSHFYLPGFDWTYWREAVATLTGNMLRGLFWIGTSPLVWPKLVALGVLAGAVRVALWARREQSVLVGVLVIAAPLVLVLAVIATSGNWSFQNYRYIAPAFPLLAILAGIALAPPRRLPLWPRRAWLGVAAIALALFARAAAPGMRADMLLFAQGAMDTNTQVVKIGEYLHDKLPDAYVMFHDAGAVSYYGDTRVYDMLGLVTNFQAGVANNGPGSRFEFLEDLPPDQRPTHFAYYPGWMGNADFYGEVLLHTALRPGFESRRLVGEGDMQLIVASWDHVHTAERPLDAHDGWTLVDRVDVADLASERAHHWIGRMGRRHLGDPTARWSLVERETAGNLVIDGGRTIRDGGERFTITLDPKKPTRVVLRTGGQTQYPFHEAITTQVTMTLWAGTKQLGKLVVPPPRGVFEELTFNLPPYAVRVPTVELRTEANAPYRVFHWFVLQPQ